LNEDEGDFEDWRGRVYKIIIDIIKAITPPNLLGIERRIA